MSRKREEINPECGRRLKSLLARSGITQKQLAEKLSYTPQHISQIVQGNRRMPFELAQRIIQEVFPEYRVEWLMGRDDIKTEDDRISKYFDAMEKKQDLILSVIELHGYIVKDVTKEMPVQTDAQGMEYRPATIAITSPRGSVRYLSHKDLQEIVSDIDDYIEYKCISQFKKLLDGVKNIYESG